MAGEDPQERTETAERHRAAAASGREDASAAGETDDAAGKQPQSIAKRLPLAAMIQNKLGKVSAARPKATAASSRGPLLPALASGERLQAAGGRPSRESELRAAISRFQSDARRQPPQPHKPAGARRTADKAVQTASPSVAAAAAPDDEASSTSIEMAQQHSLSRSNEAPRRRLRGGAFRVLPWLARVNSSSLAASKEELDKLYKENADLVRRLAEARPSAAAFKSGGEPGAAQPREYEMYVSNTSKKKTRSISIQIDMPKFRSKKKNRMTTEATILMLIRKLRRVLRANRTQPVSRS